MTKNKPLKISSTLVDLPFVRLSEVEDLQGGLKDLSKVNFDKLKKRLDKTGFKYPLYLWSHNGKYYNLDGNQRKRVIMATWGDVELPYIEVEAENEKAARKEILAISSQYGEVTKEGFDEFTFDFEEMDFDEVVDETTFDGWMDKEIPEAEEDNYEEPDDLQVDVALGDLIEIGEHRLLCGSSTEVDAWSRLMDGDLQHLLITHPQYNVHSTGKKMDSLKIENDSMSDSDFYKFLYDFYTALNSFVKAGGAWYVWHADSEGANFRRAMIDSGIMLKQCLIWAKNSMVMGNQDYQWKHESCLYGWKPGASHNWYSDRKQTTILEFDRPNRNGEHPTMKPIPLIAYQIGNSSKVGDVVADGFLGSETTMAASHQLNRKCYGMELDPRYCQVIIDRMRKLDPKLEIKINGKAYINE